MEKRIYPRVNVSFPIKIDSSIVGESVNISETGLSAVLDKPLLLSKAIAEVVLSPKESITTEVKIIWNKGLIEKKASKYGVCFIRLKESDLAALRSIWIHKAIEPTIDKISNAEIKKKVFNFFTLDCKKYVSQLDVLTSKMKDAEISLDEACRRSEKFTDSIIEKGHELESLLEDKILVRKLKETFRIVLGPWGYRGKILKRAFEKPRGYPGDYLMIEAIYDNKTLSEYIGYCSDMYFLNNKYAIAVRNRKNLMKEMLKEFMLKQKSIGNRILNIACGSCREIAELFCAGFKPASKASFILVDHDEEALSFSKKALSMCGSDIQLLNF